MHNGVLSTSSACIAITLIIVLPYQGGGGAQRPASELPFRNLLFLKCPNFVTFSFYL